MNDEPRTSEPRPGLCFLSFLFREYEDGAAVPIDRVSEEDAAWLGTSFTPLFFFENALKMLNLGMLTLYGHEVLEGVSRVIGGGKDELRQGEGWAGVFGMKVMGQVNFNLLVT